MPSIPVRPTLGAVHLGVAALDRSVAYYEGVVGLRVRERAGEHAFLGVGGEDLLVLHERSGARPARRTAGLFHVALLVPERVDLANWLQHASSNRVVLTGSSDHFVSEALYLRDPDEHGIEIYWDRPRSIWEGQVAQRLTSEPLDTRSLLAAADPSRESPGGLATGTVLGHVHLRVSDVPASVAFYTSLLDFELMATLGSRAAFLSRGGYHHHIGVNSWESAGAGQAPPGSATLERVTLALPARRRLDEFIAQAAEAGHPTTPTAAGVLVADPSGNPLEIRAAAAAEARS